MAVAAPQSLDKSEVEFPPQRVGEADPRAGRRRRYALQATAAGLMRGEGVAKCGRYAAGNRDAGGFAAIKLGARGAHMSQILRCNSVWHCPVCAASIAAGRREEVKLAVQRHQAAGGAVYMLTCTIPHQIFDRCATTREAVALAWRYVQAGKAWKALKASFQIVGMTRALEVTHGGNGWHPHLHILIYTAAPLPDAGDMLGAAMVLRWIAAVERCGYGRASPAAQKFELCRDTEKAADYIAKELTLAHMKEAKFGGRSAWQILASVEATDDARDADLWREYALAFKGARQLTWTRGLRERYGLRDESDDELNAKEPPARTLAEISEELLQVIVRRRLVSRMLDIAEREGAAGLLRFFRLFECGLAHVRNVEATPPEPEPYGPPDAPAAALAKIFSVPREYFVSAAQ